MSPIHSILPLPALPRVHRHRCVTLGLVPAMLGGALMLGSTSASAIHAAGGNHAYLDHAELLDNVAAISGGAIFGTDLHLDVYDSLVSGNQAVAEDGGGVFLGGGSALGGVANAFPASSNCISSFSPTQLSHSTAIPTPSHRGEEATSMHGACSTANPAKGTERSAPWSRESGPAQLARTRPTAP